MKKLVATFAGLSAFDIGLTLFIVQGGQGTELNPVMAHILTLPLWIILFFNIGVPIILGTLLIFIDRTIAAYYVRPRGVLILANLAMLGVVIFNLKGVLSTL